MDESWKFWPAQGHLCPVCATPHFPFCSMPPPPPPPHAFDRYRPTAAEFHRFPPSVAPPFLHNPPLWDHRLPPPPMPYPPESWGLHHVPEREVFRPVIHPPPQRFLPDELLGGESSYKRMRVEGPPMGSLHPPPSYDRPEFVPGMFSADDERRLNLIRDHGKQKAMERQPQCNGELLPDKSARDVLLNQYNDVGADHGLDGPKFSSVGRGGPILPQDRNFDPPIQFTRPKPFEAHQNFSGALGSYGDERFVSHEGLNFERSGAYNSHLSEYNSAHCERKDCGGGTGVGDYSNVGHNHSDVPFQRLDSYKDGSAIPNSDHNIQQGQPKKYNSHDFQEFHPPKDSPHTLLQPHFSEPGSYNHLQDGTGKKGYYPEFEDYTEHRFKHPCEQTEATRLLPETKLPDVNNTQTPLKPANYSLIEEPNAKTYVVQGRFPPVLGINNSDAMTKEMHVRMHAHGVYPSLSTSLPVGHLDPSLKHAPRPSPSPGVPPAALFPVLESASAMTPVPPNKTYPDPHALPQSSSCREISHPSTEIANKELAFINQAPLKLDGVPKVPVDNSMKIKPTIIDACDLFKQPRCASRPDHIVIILRGLPGSGKSYLAKALRDLEIENGASAPRIHAMDDYFMIEVEKTVDDSEGSKPSGLSRVKKQTTKKVIEYCYELEMEKAYRSSMLKAFRKTLEEGIFTFVIVDDRNLRVADFAQFWAIAKRSGYEVYLLEAPYKDPAGCAARNVHGFTLEDIQKMAEKWEEAPPIYLQLDIQSLFHGDNMNEHSIQEVDMDITDSDCDDDSSKLQNEDKESLKPLEPRSVAFVPDQDLLKAGERWESDEEEEEQSRVKELGSSKWSKDLDEDEEKAKGVRGNLNALSGLIQAYSKGGKSVHWGDQSDKSGFSIGVVKKKSSLIIGPGAGYNLTSNPLTEDQVAAEATESSTASESKRQFSEKLRAEHESIRAVLKKRQQRIGGFFNIEDD